MAKNTPKSYRNQVLYSVYVRNYSSEGTFEGVRKDLDRIQALGTDIIWLLPIHPLGEKARKGKLGSPYAIRDYRAVNPEFGTLEDFKRLVDDIHAHGMKCIIDVVYNHTSPDSWLAENHPEWFFHKPDGSFGNRIGDWTDIIDLDYSHKELWDYQIETLKQWAEIVDGFRCDVAPLVPVEFWLKAREEVETVRPGCFWLCESVDRGFISHVRGMGMTAHSDSELYQAYDAAYDYDTYHDFVKCLTGKISLAQYAAAVTDQDITYPDNYLKLRFLENHDQPRAHQLIADPEQLVAWTAFQFFQKGMPLIYNGQEVGAAHLPSLFDKDPIFWDTGMDLTPLMQKMAKIRRSPIFADSQYAVTAPTEDVLLAVYTSREGTYVGLFPVGGRGALVEVDVPDGTYRDDFSGGIAEVHFGKVSCGKKPVIFKA